MFSPNRSDQIAAALHHLTETFYVINGLRLAFYTIERMLWNWRIVWHAAPASNTSTYTHIQSGDFKCGNQQLSHIIANNDNKLILFFEVNKYFSQLKILNYIENWSILVESERLSKPWIIDKCEKNERLNTSL